MSGKLTKAQRNLLAMAATFFGGVHVYQDQRKTASTLVARGLARDTGSLIDPRIVPTPAGRAALAEHEEKAG